MTPPDLRTDALDYELPERLIATEPAHPRDSARLLVMRKSEPQIEHRRVCDLPEYLQQDDVLVLNNTSVIPARLMGRRQDSGGKVEGLFLNDEEAGRWRVMLKSNGKLRPGMRIELELPEGGEESGGGVRCLVLEEKDGAEWIVRLEPEGQTREVLEEVGKTPLPPYILRARGENQGDDLIDRKWYQTTYADRENMHSVAAPTAGLHFTPQLLAKLQAQGVCRAEVTLHVGAGTFKPITAETLSGHEMHWERYEVPPRTIEMIGQLAEAREMKNPRRCIAVGTTSVRTLESLPEPLPTGLGESIIGRTDLLITPGYSFRHVDGLLTNFHLPRSTLLALVGAMVGLDRLLEVYQEAIAREYRFYSYGDAMLILP